MSDATPTDVAAVVVDDPAPGPPPVAEDPDKLPDNHPVLLALKKANKEAERSRARLAAAEEASQTEAERAVAAAKAEGFAEAMSSAHKRIIQTEVRAAATGVLVDPDDAVLYIDLDQFEIDDDGAVDTKSIAAAVAGLVKAKPHLAAGAKPQPLPGGGATPSTGSSIDDTIRAQARGKPV